MSQGSSESQCNKLLAEGQETAVVVPDEPEAAQPEATPVVVQVEDTDEAIDPDALDLAESDDRVRPLLVEILRPLGDQLGHGGGAQFLGLHVLEHVVRGDVAAVVEHDRL